MKYDLDDIAKLIEDKNYCPSWLTKILETNEYATTLRSHWFHIYVRTTVSRSSWSYSFIDSMLENKYLTKWEEMFKAVGGWQEGDFLSFEDIKDMLSDRMKYTLFLVEVIDRIKEEFYFRNLELETIREIIINSNRSHRTGEFINGMDITTFDAKGNIVYETLPLYNYEEARREIRDWLANYMEKLEVLEGFYCYTNPLPMSLSDVQKLKLSFPEPVKISNITNCVWDRKEVNAWFKANEDNLFRYKNLSIDRQLARSRRLMNGVVRRLMDAHLPTIKKESSS